MILSHLCRCKDCRKLCRKIKADQGGLPIAVEFCVLLQSLHDFQILSLPLLLYEIFGTSSMFLKLTWTVLLQVLQVHTNYTKQPMEWLMSLIAMANKVTLRTPCGTFPAVTHLDHSSQQESTTRWWVMLLLSHYHTASCVCHGSKGYYKSFWCQGTLLIDFNMCKTE